MLCALILYVSGGTFNLTSTPNNKLFEELLHGSFICSQSSCQKSDERKCRTNVFFFFIFRFDANPGFTSNKSTHYLLDYGDSNISWSEILRHPEIWKHCQFFSHFISIWSVQFSSHFSFTPSLIAQFIFILEPLIFIGGRYEIKFPAASSNKIVLRIYG